MAESNFKQVIYKAYSRMLFKKSAKGNELIKTFMEKQKKADYIDVYHSMYDADGKILTNIFLSDKLHMNAAGYKIWQGIIAPYLVTN